MVSLEQINQVENLTDANVTENSMSDDLPKPPGDSSKHIILRTQNN